MNLADAMERARVLDFELQKQLVPYMRDMVPLPGIYDPAFIAANQARGCSAASAWHGGWGPLMPPGPCAACAGDASMGCKYVALCAWACVCMHVFGVHARVWGMGRVQGEKGRGRWAAAPGARQPPRPPATYPLDSLARRWPAG